MRVLRIIKVIGYLLQNVIMRRSKYDLSFHREDDGVWYVDFPDWSFSHHNLAMVGGADKLCSYLADGKQIIRVAVVASQHPLSLSGYGLLTNLYQIPFFIIAELILLSVSTSVYECFLLPKSKDMDAFR